jgi:hypothetical protein
MVVVVMLPAAHLPINVFYLIRMPHHGFVKIFADSLLGDTQVQKTGDKEN